MSRQLYFRLIRGEIGGPLGHLARAGLRVVSWVFSVAARSRGSAYDVGILRARHPGVPVISVGNLTTGGTGKTPMVAWLAGWLGGRGHRVAVLSRGYRALPGQVGDELQLLSASADIIAVQNPDRVAGAEEAKAQGATVILLDDGFQHRRIARDRDIVLLSALHPFGGGALLPRGLLREPPKAVRRADLAVVTHADLVDPAELDGIRQRIAALAPDLPIVCARHRPVGVAVGEQSHPVSVLEGRRVLAFCGLGSPASFFGLLRRCGADIVREVRFADHHPYTSGDLETLAESAAGATADWAVTTEKDAVRMTGWPSSAVPLARLEVDLAFSDEDELQVGRTVESCLA